MHTVHGNKFFMVFHRDQYLVRLFSICFCVSYFLEAVTVASYVDDTTPYSADKTNDLVIKEIEYFSEALFIYIV